MQVGAYDVAVVPDGRFRLDGGGMFGVVPKTLWEREHAADDRNRIELALNCLLVRGEGRVILVDAGMGQDWTDEERDRYGLERPEGDVVEALGRCGVDVAEVTDVVITHLHFDHAGGVMQPGKSGPELTFPEATHWVQSQNLRWAQVPTERDRRSFHAPTVALLQARGERLRVVEGATSIAPGVRTFVVNGHTPGQQVVLVESGAEGGSVFFAGDLIPLVSHLRIPYGMAYDLNPVITLSEKKEYLARAVASGWVLVFDHDPKVRAASVEAENAVFRLGREVEL